MIIQDIFRVLYSPFKAFEKLAKTPDVKGPLLILLLTLLASASLESIKYSKILLETDKNSGEYTPLIATDLFSDRLILALSDTVFGFLLSWLIYGALFLLVLKLFRAKEGPWHKLFVLVGYTFIVVASFTIVSAILISAFPTINFKFETWTGAFLEMKPEAQDIVLQKTIEIWIPLPAYQIASYLLIAVEVWTAALGAVAIHFLREVSWNKALIISAIVSVMSLFLRFPLIFLGI